MGDYIKQIQKCPEKVKRNPVGEQLQKKIDTMQKENQRLREFIATAKINCRPVEL
jgi:hypothetical protein